ncbi:hypothetical protein [Vreelandella alkaliphila]|uniref:Uncharacterized protein n=1 Tax=Vreelandella alkaliphila TaxID=272774 RepID=A0A7C9KUK8_9GAMM|nr:hypothetical protein [Halomonas alkaliphila]NDL69337.1 hypothetical protein [Halomonas alkaliphila]
MSRFAPQLDKLEDLLGNISGLTDILQQDLRHKDSDGETSTLNNHQIGCLLSAIDELANRGYHALDAIEKASQGQEVAS